MHTSVHLNSAGTLHLKDRTIPTAPTGAADLHGPAFSCPVFRSGTFWTPLKIAVAIQCWIAIVRCVFRSMTQFSKIISTNFGFLELLSLQFCLLHDDFVRIPGAKIFVQSNLSFERYNVPDINFFGGRDCQIETA